MLPSCKLAFLSVVPGVNAFEHAFSFLADPGRSTPVTLFYFGASCGDFHLGVPGCWCSSVISCARPTAADVCLQGFGLSRHRNNLRAVRVFPHRDWHLVGVSRCLRWYRHVYFRSVSDGTVFAESREQAALAQLLDNLARLPRFQRQSAIPSGLLHNGRLTEPLTQAHAL